MVRRKNNIVEKKMFSLLRKADKSKKNIDRLSEDLNELEHKIKKESTKFNKIWQEIEARKKHGRGNTRRILHGVAIERWYGI